jgi:hypothetical protein
MAVTQEEIDAQRLRVAGLNQMIADGVRQVTLGDQTITYNTTDSLIRARDDAQDVLTAMEAKLAGTARSGRQTQLLYNGRGCWP